MILNLHTPKDPSADTYWKSFVIYSWPVSFSPLKIPEFFQDYKYVLLNYRKICVKWNKVAQMFHLTCSHKKLLLRFQCFTEYKRDKASMKRRGEWHRAVWAAQRKILWTLLLLLYPKEDITVACESAVCEQWELQLWDLLRNKNSSCLTSLTQQMLQWSKNAKPLVAGHIFWPLPETVRDILFHVLWVLS